MAKTKKSRIQSKQVRIEQVTSALSDLTLALETSLKLPKRSLHNVEDDTPKFLNPKQTSKLLGLSVKTLANNRSTGLVNLPYIKIGSRIFYKRSDLIKYLEERKFNNTSAYHSFPQTVEAK